MLRSMRDLPPPRLPVVPFWVWLYYVVVVEMLAILISTLVLTRLGVDEKRAFMGSCASVLTSFGLGLFIWAMVGVL